jgi:hypothetical protein
MVAEAEAATTRRRRRPRAGGAGFSVASFGEDAAGELYLLDVDGQVLRFES